MPFPMKIQPFDPSTIATRPAPKSRLKRLFEKQFAGVLRNNSSEKLVDAEVGSICLDKMVINFIEESNNGDGNKGKCGKRRCNCFHGNCDDSSDDEAEINSGELPAVSASDAAELIKGMVVCASVAERNLLADVASLVDNHKTCKHKNELRRIVADRLRSDGRDASVCKSKWDKSPSFPAGEYEYIDVVFDKKDRIIVDIDFKLEFQIAWSTKSHRAVVQSLPSIFVGRSDRLLKIISLVSESARLSLKKKGLSFPPWRKTEYMRNKWLSDNYERLLDQSVKVEGEIVKEKSTAVIEWDLPPVKPKVNVINKQKMVTGIGFLLREI